MSDDLAQMPPGVRRWWLLVEALKSAPLREALTTARKAEAFLLGFDEKSQPKQANAAETPSAASESAQAPAGRHLH